MGKNYGTASKTLVKSKYTLMIIILENFKLPMTSVQRVKFDEHPEMTSESKHNRPPTCVPTKSLALQLYHSLKGPNTWERRGFTVLGWKMAKTVMAPPGHWGVRVTTRSSSFLGTCPYLSIQAGAGRSDPRLGLFSKKKTEAEIPSRKYTLHLAFSPGNTNRPKMLHVYSDWDRGCPPRLKTTHTLDLMSKIIRTPELARSWLLNGQMAEKQAGPWKQRQRRQYDEVRLWSREGSNPASQVALHNPLLLRFPDPQNEVPAPTWEWIPRIYNNVAKWVGY